MTVMLDFAPFFNLLCTLSIKPCFLNRQTLRMVKNRIKLFPDRECLMKMLSEV